MADVLLALAPETPGDIDPYQIMGVLFGKLALFAYEGRDLTRRHPAADTLALLAAHLANAMSVTRMDNHAVRIDDPAPARGTDVFGRPVPVIVADGRVRLARSGTPVFVTV